MKNLVQMIFYRLQHNTIYFLLALFVPPVVVIAALIYTNNIEQTIRLGVVGDFTIQEENIKVESLEEVPPLSKLVQGKYDAVVEKKGDVYKIQTVKGEEFRSSLDQVLNHGKSMEEAFQSGEKRGVISNLTGFLSMLTLLIGSMMYKFYYQEKGAIERRILATKISYIQYSLSHCLVVFLILFVPTVIITLFAKWILAMPTLATYGQIAFILFTLCLLGSSFSFFIASISNTEENGSLISTMIILVSSLVSGSFIEVAQSGIENTISHLFPQRYIVNFAIAIENGLKPGYTSMIVIILSCIFMILIGTWINKKQNE